MGLEKITEIGHENALPCTLLKKEQEGNYRLGNLINQNPIHKVELGTYIHGISSIFEKCSMLQQTQ